MKISIKKTLLFAAAFFGLAAFIMFFLSPLAFNLDFGMLGKSTTNLKFSEVYFNSTIEIEGLKLGETVGATLSIIGYLLILLNAVLFALLGLGKVKKGKKAKVNYLSLVVCIPALVGVLFVFLTKSNWISANELKDSAELYSLGIGPILGGVFGLLSAIAGAFGLLSKK